MELLSAAFHRCKGGQVPRDTGGPCMDKKHHTLDRKTRNHVVCQQTVQDIDENLRKLEKLDGWR